MLIQYFYSNGEYDVDIPEIVFFSVFFICQKYQNIILNDLINVLEEKEKHKFKENEWNIYFSKNKFFYFKIYYNIIVKKIPKRKIKL